MSEWFNTGRKETGQSASAARQVNKSIAHYFAPSSFDSQVAVQESISGDNSCTGYIWSSTDRHEVPEKHDHKGKEDPSIMKCVLLNVLRYN